MSASGNWWFELCTYKFQVGNIKQKLFSGYSLG